MLVSNWITELFSSIKFAITASEKWYDGRKRMCTCIEPNQNGPLISHNKCHRWNWCERCERLKHSNGCSRTNMISMNHVENLFSILFANKDVNQRKLRIRSIFPGRSFFFFFFLFGHVVHVYYARGLAQNERCTRAKRSQWILSNDTLIKRCVESIWCSWMYRTLNTWLFFFLRGFFCCC